MGSFRFPSSEDEEDLGPPPGPFQFRTRPRFSIPGGLMRWAGVLAFLLVLFIIASIAKGIYADWLWFDSVEDPNGQDYLSIFRLRIVTRIWLFFAGAGVFLLFFGGNVLIALRQTSGRLSETAAPLAGIDTAAAGRLVVVIAIAAALFLSVIFGAQAASEWDNILLFINGQSFGVDDPLFHQDIGFYVFRLPTLNFIVAWSLGAVILTTIAVGAIYAFRLLLGGLSADAPSWARPHISLLLVVTLGFFIGRYWLGRFSLVYSERGAAFGAGWTDVNAQLPVIYVLMALAGLAALAILISIFWRGLIFLPIAVTVLWVVAAIVGGLIYPATVQRFTVEPNELVKEREFIQRNIDATRAAYGLDQIEVLPDDVTPARDFVTPEEIEDNPGTIQNIRLWDNRPLLTTLNRRQTFRPRYDFLDVDVDRYMIDGELRQVMLAARELNQDRVPVDARSWVNLRLQFTHGFGLAMTPVNEVVQEGLPAYFVEGLPPRGKLEIEQPRIYYGEMPDQYVIVNTEEDEFDFQAGDEEKRNRFDGGGGVELGSLFRRFVYAWEFADTNILISDALTDESRLLYRRNIRERIETIAPFLALDSDVYLVVTDGGLFWIQDAYTQTDLYPYSTRTAGLNYIRNSVKVVVNAYDGSVTFYRIDGAVQGSKPDPIAEAYSEIYPDLFTPFDEMPEALVDHIRYPLDLFHLQASVYTTYHITDTDRFFNKEDLWEIPTEVFIDRRQPLEPYYVIMRLPGAEQPEEEFALILPFSPANKEIAIAWLAARSDGEHYGKLLAFRLPTDRVFATSQVEARIDQDTTISQQLTLWNQSGSQVIRGNLLMIPIGGGNLFVEPIYLQATEGAVPELKRVVVINGNCISMERRLDEALAVALDPRCPSTTEVEQPEPAPSPTPEATPGADVTPAPTPTAEPTAALPEDIGALIEEANTSFERAQELLQAGDFAGYGEEIDRLEDILGRLGDLTQGQ